MSKIYRLICILDSVEDGNKTLSNLDASPDYLHIHILESENLESIEKFSQKISNESPSKDLSSILYQWGIPLEKEAHTRSARVSDQEIKKFGQIGIGSAARGNDESRSDFIGGGEGFLFDSQSFRITKGNKIFEMNDDEKYWIFQVCDFGGAQKISEFNQKKIDGRENLKKILKEKSGNRPLIATFDAEFEGDFFARSNGIFPDDKIFGSERSKSLFDREIKGGHLVGGSKNEGDIESLRQKFSEEKISDIDFSLKITSDILLKKIDELKIVRQGGEFSKPRTSIEANKAASLIQNFFRTKTKENYGKNSYYRRRHCRLRNRFRIIKTKT